jgi:hypothetical protein
MEGTDGENIPPDVKKVTDRTLDRGTVAGDTAADEAAEKEKTDSNYGKENGVDAASAIANR